MPLDRTWYNTLVDDDGSNTTGSLIDKADIDALMDAVDASLVDTMVTSTAVGAQNNLAPTLGPNTVLSWNGASALALTGVAGGSAGYHLWIRNNSTTQQITIAHAGASAGGNQFYNMAATGLTPIAPGGVGHWIHDGGFWVLVYHDQGTWITPPYVAGHFIGSGAMTWTVDAGDIVRSRYRVRGKELTYSFAATLTSVGGTPATILTVLNGQFGGFTLVGQEYVAVPYANDNGVIVSAYVAGFTNAIGVLKTAGANWSAATNATYIYFVWTGEVQ